MSKNAWGVEIEPRPEAMGRAAVRTFLAAALPRYLGCIGVPASETAGCVGTLLDLGQRVDDEREYLRRIRAYIAPRIDRVVLTRSRDRRARKLAGQIAPHLSGGVVVDLGCGDGAVGRLLSRRRRDLYIGADVFRSAEFDRASGGAFAVIGPDDHTALPAGCADAVVLANVLHHAERPRRVLREAARLLKPRARLVIVEAMLDPQPPTDTRCDRTLTRLNLALSQCDRTFTTGFVDQLANTAGWSPGIEDPVSCPLNFNTRRGWRSALNAAGCEGVRVFDLGVDQPLGAGMFHGLLTARRSP